MGYNVIAFEMTNEIQLFSNLSGKCSVFINVNCFKVFVAATAKLYYNTILATRISGTGEKYRNKYFS